MQSKFVLILGNYLHLLAMAGYLGGSFVMEFVLGPAQRFIPPAQAQVMGEKTADRFLWIAWGSLGLALLSGLLRLWSMERVAYVYGGDSLLSTSYGWSLFGMMTLWLVLVINGSIITFVLRPKLKGRQSAHGAAAQAQAHQQAQIKAATWIGRLTRVDLGVAFVIVLFGASIRQGGFW